MANEQTRGMTDFATQTTADSGDVQGRAREAVQQVKERAGERIESRIADSKSRAAETLSGVASSLLSSSQQLRDRNQSGASRAVERAAEGVDRFAHYLQDTNVDDVVDQVYEFARRQPAAFIGGAFALGFIASRFLKASSPEGGRHRLSAVSDYSRGYETSYPLGDSRREVGYGNIGDPSGSLGYGAGLSTTGGGTTGGGYTTMGGSSLTDATRSDPQRTGGSDAGSR